MASNGGLDNLSEALAAGLGGIFSATVLYPIEMWVCTILPQTALNLGFLSGF